MEFKEAELNVILFDANITTATSGPNKEKGETPEDVF